MDHFIVFEVPYCWAYVKDRAHMCFVDYKVLKSPTLNGSSAIQCFERSDVIEIRDGILFNFYTGLSHNYINCTSTKMLTRLMIMIFIAHILLSENGNNSWQPVWNHGVEYDSDGVTRVPATHSILQGHLLPWRPSENVLTITFYCPHCTIDLLCTCIARCTVAFGCLTTTYFWSSSHMYSEKCSYKLKSLYVSVDVLDRNQTLFSCCFWSMYCSVELLLRVGLISAV